MGTAQSTYTEKHVVARAGMIANMHTYDADTYIVDKSSGISFGRMCGRDGTDDNHVGTNITAANYVGISIIDPTVTESDQRANGDGYANDDLATVCYRGDVWVEVAAAVTAGAKVYAVPASGVLADTSSSNIEILGAVFLDDAAADGFARVRLSGSMGSA